MTEQLHYIENCIKHKPNYDREFSKCNFKPGWHKSHQEHMSALNTNRNVQAVLLGDSLIQGLSRPLPRGFREIHIR